jgi:hypothetical protein
MVLFCQECNHLLQEWIDAANRHARATADMLKCEMAGFSAAHLTGSAQAARYMTKAAQAVYRGHLLSHTCNAVGVTIGALRHTEQRVETAKRFPPQQSAVFRQEVRASGMLFAAAAH